MESLLDRARVHLRDPMVMLNLNRYKADVEFPYRVSPTMAAIATLLRQMEEPFCGELTFRAPLWEVSKVFMKSLQWYPNYEAFTSLPDADGAKKCFGIGRFALKKRTSLNFQQRAR